MMRRYLRTRDAWRWSFNRWHVARQQIRLCHVMSCSQCLAIAWRPDAEICQVLLAVCLAIESKKPHDVKFSSWRGEGDFNYWRFWPERSYEKQTAAEAGGSYLNINSMTCCPPISQPQWRSRPGARSEHILSCSSPAAKQRRQSKRKPSFGRQFWLGTLT